jgi:hypothetical protein
MAGAHVRCAEWISPQHAKAGFGVGVGGATVQSGTGEASPISEK